ncbi:11-beta-hydroxysteroid dehydrogenase 1B [Thalictrum thalictroides]|uniref:11-beta-hydroxysteroid dehydrogenase 1B n=1 Tax=Thalictrum thalictroides TaxID=46969 RepID=A0A7J6WFW6_THATH|nr:11-beta-hydroxysteroid dehydrogenase 1B [Thalictrum thalictroides]
MFLPPFYFFKFFLFTLRFLFSENVAGKVVLITGASSGIGEQLAYQYARRGACLVLVARRENRLQEVAEIARQYGSPDVLVIRADVAIQDDCRRFVEEAIEHFGQLDHLVNNAGIASGCMFEDAQNVDNFRPVMDINFWGAIYPSYFAIPHLRQRNGKIVAIASIGGWLAVPRMGFYNASKAALINFYECLRAEVGNDIGITIVTPGFIESEMSQGKFLSKGGKMTLDQELRDTLVGTIPVRHGEECAKGIVNGVCRGDKYITEPSWYNVLYLWRVFCPEVLEWFNHLMLVPAVGTSTETLSKKILDVTRAKYFLYPTSIQESELKTD